MFTCYKGQFTHDILLSIFLAMQGHRIMLGYIPKLRSPIKERFRRFKKCKYLYYICDEIVRKKNLKVKLNVLILS